LKPTAVSVVGDNVTWTFSLTVPANQTRELGYFTLQAADRAQAINQMNALLDANSFRDTAALGLNAGDLAALANFQFDHAPVDITLSNTSVSENQAGAVIGTLATIDPDQGGSYAYALTDDSTGKFEIVGNTLKLKDGEWFDFEAMSDPTLKLAIRTTDNPGGLSFEKEFTVTVVNVAEPMIVLPSDLPATGTANLTLSLESDGKLHVLKIDGASATDVVPPVLFTDVSNVSITGRDGFGETLRIDSIPSGGVYFNGGSIGEGNGNTLVIGGVSPVNSVSVTSAQVIVNASAPIAYSNVSNFAFDLGAGANSLWLDHVTLVLARDEAISAGTKVTVDGSMLDFNGHADSIGNLTLTNGGQAHVTALVNTATTVTSGTLTATSIVCDTLTIGSPSVAAVQADNSHTVVPLIDETPPTIVSETSASTVSENTAIDSTAIENMSAVEQAIPETAVAATTPATPAAPVLSALEVSWIAPADLPVAGQATSNSEIISAAPLPKQADRQDAGRPQPLLQKPFGRTIIAEVNAKPRIDNQFAQALSRPSFVIERLHDSIYEELTDFLVRTKKQLFAVASVSQSTHILALQSIAREFQHNYSVDQEDLHLLSGEHSRKQEKLAKKAVDDFHLRLIASE
jgi:hypothetical protein